MSCPKKLLMLGMAFVLSLPIPASGDDQTVGAGTRTRGLIGGWGHSWRPVFGKTRSVVTFAAFQPRMGWYVTDRIELYGEGTLFLYDHPSTAVAAGLGGLAGRYYLKTSGRWNRMSTPAPVCFGPPSMSRRSIESSTSSSSWASDGGRPGRVDPA